MYDVAVIGCGVVGAATAYALARWRVGTLILEKENDVSTGTSRANSAIIHAGYDAETGTLMADLNVRGNAMTQAIVEALDVPFIRTGSLVLAFGEEDAAHLKTLYDRGVANGVPGMAILSGDAARAMEPNLSDKVASALWAPTAGVISPWEYTLAMAEAAVDNGARFERDAEVTAIEKKDGYFELKTKKGVFSARFVVNAAGVEADHVHDLAAPHAFTVVPVRGQYDLLDKSEGGRVKSVIFQCPGPMGKGVLVAPTAHGNLIVGPSAEKTDDVLDTATTADVLATVRERARASVPSVDLRACIRNFAGVRANLKERDDFWIAESADVPGFVDLAGIKSPGLTAAPAIGETAVSILEKAGLKLEARPDFVNRRRRIRFAELSDDEKRALVARDPAYGRVVCRCNTVTEGEILASLKTPIPPVSVDGVKRRVGTGMGRCQGGFCGPRVLDILARELHKSPLEIPEDKAGSDILTRETKTGGDEA